MHNKQDNNMPSATDEQKDAVALLKEQNATLLKLLKEQKEK